MANAMPEEKIPHRTARDIPSFNQGNQHAGHGQLTALGCKQNPALPVQQRRHQRTHDEHDADGHADAQGNPKVAHGQAITHIAHTPHGSKKRHLQEHIRIYRSIETAKIGQQQQAHRNRQQNPGKDSGHGPGSLPGPFLYLPNGRIERCGGCRAHHVPSDPSEN
jgi:hypothetical protein